jgi:hypothetical protein
VRQEVRIKLEELNEVITRELSDFKQMEQRVKIYEMKKQAMFSKIAFEKKK